LLVTTVGGAEGVVADEADTPQTTRELLFEDREDLVAAGKIIPKLADGLAFEGREPRSDIGRLHRPARAERFDTAGTLTYEGRESVMS
jgi:hypothetical protein